MHEPADPLLLNEGLKLAMAWGPDWLKPIQGRMHALHPHLTQAQLSALNTECQAAMKLGHAGVGQLLGESGSGRVDSAVIRAGLAVLVRANHPWVDEDNLGHLFSQGMYYAAK
jgi:hypothetical protein